MVKTMLKRKSISLSLSFTVIDSKNFKQNWRGADSDYPGFSNISKGYLSSSRIFSILIIFGSSLDYVDSL